MKTFITLLIIALVIIGIILFANNNDATAPEESAPSEGVSGDTAGGASADNAMEEETAESGDAEQAASDSTIVTYSSGGFSPANITVAAGDEVTFVNESSRDFWPASNVHPTHTVYPGSDIQKCFDGSDPSVIFDACRAIAPGESYSFTFTEKGTWSYHDHRRASLGGSIVVE